jgi:hypothetical protein
MLLNVLGDNQFIERGADSLRRRCPDAALLQCQYRRDPERYSSTYILLAKIENPAVSILASKDTTTLHERCHRATPSPVTDADRHSQLRSAPRRPDRPRLGPHGSFPPREHFHMRQDALHRTHAVLQELDSFGPNLTAQPTVCP